MASKSNPGGEHDYHAIDLHLRGFWPDREFEDFSWNRGPIREVLPNFRVRRLAPGAVDQSWVYASLGAFEVDAGQRVEFVVVAPAEDPIHVESLAMITHFHAVGNHPFHLGLTANLGRPWIDGATATGFMLNLPYPFGPDLEWAELPDGEPVRFLWLVPITPGEAIYATRNGTAALEDLFEQNQVDVLDPFRESIV
jgi:Suppressor of fused protein (SUFU)